MEYPKIETLYDRDPAQMSRVIVGQLRCPEFGLVDRWLLTEKVDGTNIRLILNGGVVSYGGRTDDAQMPPHLLKVLAERFPSERVAAAFEPGTDAILYGEGYGPKIQKGGGDYNQEPSFRLFDVAVFTGRSSTAERGPDKTETDGSTPPAPTARRLWWLEWEAVKDIAGKIGCRTVPVVLSAASLKDAVTLVPMLHSEVAREEGKPRVAEGVVARTVPMLLMRNGHRLVWKLKARDLADPLSAP